MIRRFDIGQLRETMRDAAERDRDPEGALVLAARSLAYAEVMFDGPEMAADLSARDDAWWKDVITRHVNERARMICVIEPGR